MKQTRLSSVAALLLTSLVLSVWGGVPARAVNMSTSGNSSSLRNLSELGVSAVELRAQTSSPQSIPGCRRQADSNEETLMLVSGFAVLLAESLWLSGGLFRV